MATLNAQSGLDRVTLSVENEGIGPAEIRSAEMLVAGRPVRNAEEFLARFGIPSGQLTRASLTNVMLRPGRAADVLRSAGWSVQRPASRQDGDGCPGAGDHAEGLLLLGLRECWIVNATNVRPRSVPQCPIVQVLYD
jgi:hypothetical protein